LDLGENNNNKPKNVVGVEGGRNNRVLQDIGNLVINQADFIILLKLSYSFYFIYSLLPNSICNLVSGLN
jgi:hypothetical protein